jgi:hypothetical protein
MMVTRVAGTFLVVGAIVVALNIRSSVPPQLDLAGTTPAIESTLPETVRLFSTFSPAQRPDQGLAVYDLWPDINLPKIRKPSKPEPDLNKPEPASKLGQPKPKTAKPPTKQPTQMSTSGHIL